MAIQSHSRAPGHSRALGHGEASGRSEAPGQNEAPVARSATNRVPDDVLLDAARHCVLTVGVRRTTLAEVARTASVSRMTLYRRFPDVRSILTALMSREFGALLDEVMSNADEQQTARARLVNGAVLATARLTADPIMRTLLEKDAELLLPYVVQRIGSTQRVAEQVLVSLISDGHQDGSIRPGAPRTQARALLLVAQSFVFSTRIAVSADDGVTEQGLLDELRQILEQSLLRLPGGGSETGQ